MAFVQSSLTRHSPNLASPEGQRRRGLLKNVALSKRSARMVARFEFVAKCVDCRRHGASGLKPYQRRTGQCRTTAGERVPGLQSSKRQHDPAGAVFALHCAGRSAVADPDERGLHRGRQESDRLRHCPTVTTISPCWAPCHRFCAAVSPRRMIGSTIPRSARCSRRCRARTSPSTARRRRQTLRSPPPPPNSTSTPTGRRPRNSTANSGLARRLTPGRER